MAVGAGGSICAKCSYCCCCGRGPCPESCVSFLVYRVELHAAAILVAWWRRHKAHPTVSSQPVVFPVRRGRNSIRTLYSRACVDHDMSGEFCCMALEHARARQDVPWHLRRGGGAVIVAVPLRERLWFAVCNISTVSGYSSIHMHSTICIVP